MTRFRRTIATLVAAATITTGAAACTPEQQAGARDAAGPYLVLVLFAFFADLAACPPAAMPSCPPFG